VSAVAGQTVTVSIPVSNLSGVEAPATVELVVPSIFDQTQTQEIASNSTTAFSFTFGIPADTLGFSQQIIPGDISGAASRLAQPVYVEINSIKYPLNFRYSRRTYFSDIQPR
jgi:hypothetical protein